MSSNYRLQLIFYPTFTWEWIEESGDDTYLSPSSEQGTPILIFRPKNISSADVDLNIDFKTLRECRYQFLWDGDMLKNHFSGRRFGTRPLLNRSNRHLGGNSLFYRSFLITAMYMVDIALNLHFLTIFCIKSREPKIFRCFPQSNVNYR